MSKWIPPVPKTQPKLKLFNSLTKQKEEFIPNHPGQVSWYVCGPTVYNKTHLGHARTYMAFDVQRRILQQYFGYQVLYVMNVTDIDDKIILSARKQYLLQEYQKHETDLETVRRNAKLAFDFFLKKRFSEKALDWEHFVATEKSDDPKFPMYVKTAQEALDAIENKEIAVQELHDKTAGVVSEWLDEQKGSTITDPSIYRDFTAYWEEDFFTTLDKLNVNRPDVITRVSEYVPEIVQYVQEIISNGYGYELDGSVYFDTLKFNNAENHSYAKLEPQSASNLKLAAEGEGELSSGKARNPADFALWKNSKPGEPFWDSPWGKGRPGWHIECSVMASAILGSNMDIHSGGIDLAFPHHDNEIAQAEAHYDHQQWVNYFLHAGHLHIEGMKMSKSLKNFLSVDQGLEICTASQMRIMFLFSNWGQTMDFSSGPLKDAKNFEATVENFMTMIKAVQQDQKGQRLGHNFGPMEAQLLQHLQLAQDQIREAFCDSFNTPKAMAELRQLISLGNQYYQDATKRSQPNASVLYKVGTFVTSILRILGVLKDENAALGTFATAGSKSQENVLEYVQALSSFRDRVRSLAQEKAEPKAILELCDKLRDEELIELGVSLEDRDGGKALVKLVDKEILLKQRQEKLEREQQKQREKQERLQQELKKKQERLERGKTAPSDLFKTDEYSQWDERGIPTKDKEGLDLAKSRRKKLEKEYQQQEKLHQEYLKSLQ
ncbi:tRNA synthetases class I (C) catalytic domain-containing protein, partial [Gorgonomyces haynaldii]